MWGWTPSREWFEWRYSSPYVDRVAWLFAAGYLRHRDGRASPAADVSVERCATVPVDVLTELYRRAVPNRYHVERDRAYYRWRFANPNWDCRTYVASRAGPVAALVVCWLDRCGVSFVRLMETVPLSCPSPDAAGVLLGAVVSDHADADVLAASEDTLPGSVLARRGFHRDDRLPLSLAATDRRLVVRPFGDPATRASDPTNRSNWLATFGEQDGIY